LKSIPELESKNLPGDTPLGQGIVIRKVIFHLQQKMFSFFRSKILLIKILFLLSVSVNLVFQKLKISTQIKKKPGGLSRSSRSFLPKMNSLPLSEVVLKIRSWEYAAAYSQNYYKYTLGL